METATNWKYLAHKPKSNYRQLFIRDRWVAARTVFGQAVGDGARTPEQLATDFRVPLEAVLEAIAYCESGPAEIIEDWQREESSIEKVAATRSVMPPAVQPVRPVPTSPE